MNKLEKLKSILKKMDSVLIAFSGGVDSAFLLKVASLVLPKNKILAVTASSATYPKEELLFSKSLARQLDVRHKVIKTDELKDKRFIANPLNRCYFCKRELFKRLKALASKFKLNFVVDASSLSDRLDFRPGEKAKQELKIRSPLMEAGFTKQDIRRTSKKLELITWDKPALACLASRIPYGVKISSLLLGRIHRAEKQLKKIGFRQVRVRHYNGLCRIEVAKNEIPYLFSKRKQVVEKFKKLGYNYVTVDLEGYRTGSMNPALPYKFYSNISGRAG